MYLVGVVLSSAVHRCLRHKLDCSQHAALAEKIAIPAKLSSLFYQVNQVLTGKAEQVLVRNVLRQGIFRVQSNPTWAIELSLSRKEASLKRGNAGLLSPPVPRRQFRVHVTTLRACLRDIYSPISRIPRSSTLPI